MSNALAIATVTQTLVNSVTASLPASLVNGWVVSTLRPDDSSLQGAETTPRVNVFLYHVGPNIAFRNADLPTRRADGTGIRRPQLALDLHYLITFYGDDKILEHQRLLGAVCRYLHAFPVLARTDVAVAEQTSFLASNLSEQSELVRLTPINLSLDDMSKLWAAFPQTDFVLSVAYCASVVLIQTDDVMPGPALPVLQQQVRAIPFSLSSISSVQPQSLALGGSPPASIDLIGSGLATGDTVAFTTPGGTEPVLVSVGAGATGSRVTVVLPAGLRAGLNSVQLFQTVSVFGSPPRPTVLSRSNSMTFTVAPVLVTLQIVSAGSMQARIFPAAGVDQQVSLVLNQMGGPLAYTLSADQHPVETDTFTFSTATSSPGTPSGSSAVPPGTYLVRVLVDSAESALTIDGSGRFNGPTVTI